ncbi:MAG: hypothetical protein K1X67_09845 [Fimbriimonadaceae bacterium]|nr:hypothetical protein [Fimbriimonadaceae bacterium]
MHTSDDRFTVATPTFPDDILNPGIAKLRITSVSVSTRVFDRRCETQASITFVNQAKSTIEIKLQPTFFFGYGPWIGAAPKPLTLHMEADNGKRASYVSGQELRYLSEIDADGCMFMMGGPDGPIQLAVKPGKEHWIKYRYSTPIGFNSQGKPGVVGHDLSANSWKRPLEALTFEAVIDPSSKWQFDRGSRGFSWKLSAKAASFQAKSFRYVDPRESMIALWLKR